MVRDGIYYALAFAAAGTLAFWLGGALPAAPFFVVGAFCAWFFRDPERALPVGPVALSPADGRVMSVVAEADRQTRISIFLNIFDVHVNRSPITGVIADVTYQRGKFLVASRGIASAENEQNIITIRADDGTVVVVKQIAGLIARRIICTKSVGDSVKAGERVGLIKFGSRVDVMLETSAEIGVKVGDHVKGGSSILAFLKTEQKQMAGAAAGSAQQGAQG